VARRVRRATLGLLALVAILALLARLRYPGLTSGLWHQMRYASLAEDRTLWQYLGYHLTFLQKLTFDPASGTYNFRNTPQDGLDGFELGRLAFHRGEFTRAIRLLERRARDREDEETLFWLALSYMRQAEVVNCLDKLKAGHGAHEHAGLCSLPLLTPHERRQASRQAARLFERLLDRYGSHEADRRLYQWLLNFSYMTLDGFPDEVPPRYRIDTPFIDTFYGERAARTRREHPELRFVDRARELGAASFGTGRGVVVEDFDRDGHLDLITTGYYGGVRYFHNDGGRRFTDVTAASGLAGVRQPITLSAADYDGDGWLDLFAARQLAHYQLFANNGDGTFRDVTAASGLLDSKPPGALAASWISTWGDVDDDGDLDLFVSSWAFAVPFVHGLPAKPRIDSKLFLNTGGGRFRDATAELGLEEMVHDRHFIGAAFGDYDGDGWLDLYIASPLPGTSVLLHNVRGPGPGRRFVAVDTPASRDPGFTAAFVDVNQDGRLDLFRAGAGDGRSSVVQAVFGERSGRFKSGRSSLYLQAPDGRFAPHEELFGGGEMPISTMGASYGDLNNDGCLDFYLGTGSPEPWFVLPNLMYLGEERDGRCTGRMTNVSMLSGFGTVQKGHGIVFFDFDFDGDQDVYSSLGGMWPADPWMSQLFVNESRSGNSWVKIRLRGRRSNFYGLGSRIEVRARRADGSAVVRTYNMDGKTGFGSAPYLAHIGLERATAIEEVRVTWLGSGCAGSYPAKLRELNVLDESACLTPPPSARRPAPPRPRR
jgi:hypothetical protein